MLFSVCKPSLPMSLFAGVEECEAHGGNQQQKCHEVVPVQLFALEEDGHENGEYREGVFIAYTNDISNLQTHTITVDTIESRLGNISVQADNLYGKGKLNAPDNAIVKITNNSPNNIVVNDITVNSATNVSNLVDGEVTQSIVKADDGAKITFNGVVLLKQEDIAKKNKDSSKSVAFTKLNSHNLGTPTNSAVIVEMIIWMITIMLIMQLPP